jgi:pimeloyl-ACP methyl ester carboxylesterase/catechol 2,3-dioxygenase-like lactoylglutathione lyase family enzyme
MPTPPPAQLTHIGLYVADLDAMVAFYTELLGLVVTDEGEFGGRRLAFLSRRAGEHHQLVLVTGRQADEEVQLLSQLSFRLDDEDLDALRWYHRRAEELGATDMEARNHGNSWSIYFRDPEGNRLEVYTATPWYVRQPWRTPLDLEASDQVIKEITMRQVEAAGTEWSPVAQWKQELGGRLGTGESEYRSIWTALRQVAFTQGWVDADGVSTRYALAGPAAAPAVLMLHGTGGHWETFARNLGPLSEHFRCVAIDMIGNGFSSKPDFDYEIPVYVDHAFATLDALGIERASLMGTSLGSWVAAWAARHRSDRVDKLVLMSPAGLVATESNMARIRAERTAAVDNPTWATIKGMFDHLLADERNRIPDIIAVRQAIYRLPETRDAIDHVLVLQDPATRDRNLLTEADWSAITAPTLVVASGQDHSEYETTARRVAGLIPGAEVLEMPSVRHWPHFEDPDLFNAATIRFLAGKA